ncbi:pilus assembly protein [Pirellulales bacterium]|nr:pilus assembly protein [Pirellulales bacterium]
MQTIQRKSRRRSVRRNGIAPIEFILSLPILMILFAMIYTIGMRAIEQSQVTKAVRDLAWRQRTEIEGSETDSEPFAFENGLSGSMEAEEEKELRVFRRLGGERISRDRTVLIAGTWDYVQVPDLFDGSGPHVEAIEELGVEGGDALKKVAEILDY